MRKATLLEAPHLPFTSFSITRKRSTLLLAQVRRSCEGDTLSLQVGGDIIILEHLHEQALDTPAPDAPYFMRGSISAWLRWREKMADRKRAEAIGDEKERNAGSASGDLLVAVPTLSTVTTQLSFVAAGNQFYALTRFGSEPAAVLSLIFTPSAFLCMNWLQGASRLTTRCHASCGMTSSTSRPSLRAPSCPACRRDCRRSSSLAWKRIRPSGSSLPRS